MTVSEGKEVDEAGLVAGRGAGVVLQVWGCSAGCSGYQQ